MGPMLVVCLDIAPGKLVLQISSPEVMRQRFIEANLTKIQIVRFTESLEFKTGEQLWNWILHGNPIPQHIISELQLSQDQIAEIIGQLHQMIHEKINIGHSPFITNEINIGIGVK